MPNTLQDVQPGQLITASFANELLRCLRDLEDRVETLKGRLDKLEDDGIDFDVGILDNYVRTDTLSGMLGDYVRTDDLSRYVDRADLDELEDRLLFASEIREELDIGINDAVLLYDKGLTSRTTLREMDETAVRRLVGDQLTEVIVNWRGAS